jgi:hypothetical protein
VANTFRLLVCRGNSLDTIGFQQESGSQGRPTADTDVGRLGVWHWLTAAVLVQALVLAVIATAIGARCQTLAASPSAMALESPIRAVFASGMTLADFRLLLRAYDLIIVRGPTDAGAFTLVSADPQDRSDRRSATVAGLRADTRVRFIQPAVNDGAVHP